MKKLILTLSLFTLLFGTAMAPPIGVLYIPTSAPIIHYDGGTYAALMDAIYKFEAGYNPFAINLKEGAYGGFQIRSNRLKHYNELNGTNYVLEDCYDLEISKKIFLYFTNHDSSGRSIPNKSWEQAAKNWNGSGPKTEIYWEKVKNLI